MSDPRAARALARVKAARRPITAVEIRCPKQGHTTASAHPIGDGEWLLWRRPVRIGVLVNDPALPRGGHGAAPDEPILFSAAEPIPPATPVGCRCATWPVPGDRVLADATGWRVASATRPTPPRVIVLT